MTWIAHGESVDPCGYARPGVRIVEVRKPRVERGRAAEWASRLRSDAREGLLPEASDPAAKAACKPLMAAFIFKDSRSILK